MKPNKVFIYTEAQDEHSDIVVRKLGDLGIEPVRLNTQDIPSLVTYDFELSSKCYTNTLEISPHGRSIDFNNLKSVLVRRPGSFMFPQQLNKQERAFVQLEHLELLKGIWETTETYWMNKPRDLVFANSKLEQLVRAKRLGFTIPDTIITSDPKRVREFYRRFNKNVIFKVLSDPLLALSLTAPRTEDGYFLDLDPFTPVLSTLTTKLNDEMIEKIESIRLAPGIFQEHIIKKTDIRVTLIGNQLFAAEIHSQDNKDTVTDWRALNTDLLTTPIELPTKIASLCINYIRSYNLNFGVIDLIRTPDNNYIFLELNSTGQFYFIELQIPEFKMMDSMVKCLIEGQNV